MIDLNDYEIAEEGFFSDPELSIDVLMDKLKAGLRAKNATPEQCDELLQKIQDEAVKFNDMIRQMANGVHEFEAHNMDKEEFLAFMKPLCDDLHKNCTALSLVKCDEDDGCIDNENELAVLREFLVASANAVAELKDELVHAPGADSPADKGVIGDDDIESVTEALEAMLADDGTDSVLDDADEDDFDDELDEAEECGIATEGVRSWLKTRKENKDAKKAKIAELRDMPANKIASIAVKAIGRSSDYVLAKGSAADEAINTEYVRYNDNSRKGEQHTKVKSGGYPMIITMRDDRVKLVTVAISPKANPEKVDIDAWTVGTIAGLLTAGTSGAAQESFVELDENGDPVMESTGMSLIDSVINAEPAMESETEIAKEYRRSTKAKTAAQLYRQAQRMKGLGSDAKAISTMQQAQRIYEALAKDATKVFRTKKVEETYHALGSTIRDKNSMSASMSALSTIFYFENCADSCKACIMKWKNKAEKKTIAELKAQLKDDRKAERARLKEEAKKAKEAKKAAKAKATESFDIDDDEALEELALEAALAVMAAEDGIVDPDDE